MLTLEAVERNLSLARKIVEESGDIALRYFRRPLKVENKLEGVAYDPVTIADREVETYIRGKLAEEFPAYGIIGEEHGETAGDGELAWIIDPIDGTRAYISGVPVWGTLLGLIERGRALGGMMHQPFTGETYVGSEAGAVLYHRGRRTELKTRKDAVLTDAVLYCTHPETFVSEADLNNFNRVAAASRLLRYGGDCYSYCLLAHGQIDLIVEGSMQPYDIVPLIPLVEAAGGVVTDNFGGSAMKGGVIVAAANERLHSQALELMQG